MKYKAILYSVRIFFKVNPTTQGNFKFSRI